jgi:hypothetical protein
VNHFFSAFARRAAEVMGSPGALAVAARGPQARPPGTRSPCDRAVSCGTPSKWVDRYGLLGPATVVLRWLGASPVERTVAVGQGQSISRPR